MHTYSLNIYYSIVSMFSLDSHNYEPAGLCNWKQRVLIFIINVHLKLKTAMVSAIEKVRIIYILLHLLFTLYIIKYYILFFSCSVHSVTSSQGDHAIWRVPHGHTEYAHCTCALPPGRVSSMLCLILVLTVQGISTDTLELHLLMLEKIIIHRRICILSYFL